MAKVSFILGIYNAERTLYECLKSIVMQDVLAEEYEILVIDGGSTDDTLDIVREFMDKHSNIRLMHNPGKLSEGRGMSKDLGVQAAKGDILIFLDHDNILLEKEWLRDIMVPFYLDHEIMASQSLLFATSQDTFFLQYVNAVGVEDPFAIPYSLVAQVVLHPERFRFVEHSEAQYYIHRLNPERVLYGGANGCAFRKEVFEIIQGYTRDVDIFASMAEHRMKVAIPSKPRVYHKTASSFGQYLKKKAIYFYRFIHKEYETKTFQWSSLGPELSGKIAFYLMVMYNLSIVGPMLLALKQFIKTQELFWLLHPFYVFIITVEYGLITLLKLPNFLKYSMKS